MSSRWFRHAVSRPRYWWWLAFGAKCAFDWPEDGGICCREYAASMFGGHTNFTNAATPAQHASLSSDWENICACQHPEGATP